jgi:hypothetical protein
MGMVILSIRGYAMPFSVQLYNLRGDGYRTALKWKRIARKLVL